MNAKDIVIKMIPPQRANSFIKRHHYSGKIVNNSKIHFGVFYNDRLEGVLQYGASLDKTKIIGLVKNTKWNNFLELNRMALTDNLPKNSESRAIGITLKLIKKHLPEIDWVITFADGTQCGDGTIYRATGFILTNIKVNKQLARFPNGEIIHKMTFASAPTKKMEMLGGRSFFDITNKTFNWQKFCDEVGAEVLEGYQLRYIKFLKPELEKNLTMDPIPYEEIKNIGARMYKGEKL